MSTTHLSPPRLPLLLLIPLLCNAARRAVLGREPAQRQGVDAGVGPDLQPVRNLHGLARIHLPGAVRGGAGRFEGPLFQRALLGRQVGLHAGRTRRRRTAAPRPACSITGHAPFELTPLAVHERLSGAHAAGGGLLGQFFSPLTGKAHKAQGQTITLGALRVLRRSGAHALAPAPALAVPQPS